MSAMSPLSGDEQTRALIRQAAYHAAQMACRELSAGVKSLNRGQPNSSSTVLAVIKSGRSKPSVNLS
jgi:hypothetical protein